MTIYAQLTKALRRTEIGNGLTEHAHIDRRFFDAERVGGAAEIATLVVGTDVTNDVSVGALSQAHFDVNHLRHFLLLQCRHWGHNISIVNHRPHGNVYIINLLLSIVVHVVVVVVVVVVVAAAAAAAAAAAVAAVVVVVNSNTSNSSHTTTSNSRYNQR